MNVLWQVLVQFIFRATFGIALAMALTPPRLVTSGFFRVHLWVMLGANTVAVLALYTYRETYQPTAAPWGVVFGLAMAIAVLCYVGGAIWLYERATAGNRLLYLVAILALTAAVGGTAWRGSGLSSVGVWGLADVVTGGLLLGSTLTAMFLGHWYLNTPTMDLVPLRGLVRLMAAAILARCLVAAVGVTLLAVGTPSPTTTLWLWVLLRWLAGLVGTGAMAFLTWQTLKVPNTQSATGILYAGVLFAFIGELMSQLLSAELPFPV